MLHTFTFTNFPLFRKSGLSSGSIPGISDHILILFSQYAYNSYLNSIKPGKFPKYGCPGLSPKFTLCEMPKSCETIWIRVFSSTWSSPKGSISGTTFRHRPPTPQGNHYGMNWLIESSPHDLLKHCDGKSLPGKTLCIDMQKYRFSIFQKNGDVQTISACMVNGI